MSKVDMVSSLVVKTASYRTGGKTTLIDSLAFISNGNPSQLLTYVRNEEAVIWHLF